MSNKVTERTPFIIAAEINMIRKQDKKAALHNAIEIGRRLKEAKNLIPHGEWSKWLEESVSYAERTAQRLMQVFDAYGDKESAAPEGSGPAQGLPNISYSHALILLTIPEEDRAQLIDDLDIETMSVREMKKAVQERNQAKQEQERAAQENAGLRQALDAEKGKNSELAKEQEGLKTQVSELQRSKQELEQAVEQKVLENKKLEESANVKSYNRVSSQLSATQVQLLTSNVAFKYDALRKAYEELMLELGMLAKIDEQVHGEYAKKVNDFLNSAVRKRMKS